MDYDKNHYIFVIINLKLNIMKTNNADMVYKLAIEQYYSLTHEYIEFKKALSLSGNSMSKSDVRQVNILTEKIELLKKILFAE